MTLQALTCPRCTAPFHLPPGAMVARCNYCGSEVTLAGGPGQVPLQASSGGAEGGVGRALLLLESHIGWNAVSPAWRTERDAWVRAVEAAQGPGQVAQCLAALEANLGWNAVAAEWQSRRPAWV